MTLARVALVLVLVVAACNVSGERPQHRSAGTPEKLVTVTVDASSSFQTMQGFGSNIQPFDGFGQDRLPAAIRREMLRVVYGKIGLTHARINGTSHEYRANDNADPFVFNWDGFDWTRAKRAAPVVRDLRKRGVSVDYLDTSQHALWNLDPRGMVQSVDELVESALAALVYYRDVHGIWFDWVSLFSEPGHRRMGMTTAQCVEAVKRLGRRLRALGFDRVRLLIPDDITIGASLEKAAAILADSEARPYVGAIGYHPYNGTYEDPAWVLRTSARGAPDPAEVRAREAIRALGERYGLPVWMTEVSYNGRLKVGGFSVFLTRANNIFDDLEFAHASAWYGMHAIWQDAGGEHGPRGGDQAVVDFRLNGDGSVARWGITPTGYAIGHYARWVKGSRRVRVTSDEPLVRVQAFRHPHSGEMAVLAINNDDSDHRAAVRIRGGGLGIRSLRGERSTSSGYWIPLEGIPVRDPTSVEILLPGRSVTTLAGLLERAGDAGFAPDVLEPSTANPILTRGDPGEFDGVKVGPRVVLKEGPKTYKMWYEGVPGANRASVGYATSNDGLTWKKFAGSPVLDPSEPWEGGAKGEISPNTILREGGVYKLWYHSWDGKHRRIGYATSFDGLQWTKFAGNPVLDVGKAGAWDAFQVGAPTVMKVGDRYHMWYAGLPGKDEGWRIGLATSPDGIRWTKHPGNPVFTPGPSGAWDDWGVLPGGIIWDGGRFHLWYSAFNKRFNSGVGYAWSADGLRWTRSPRNAVLSRSDAVVADCREAGDSVTAYRDGAEVRILYGGWDGKKWAICMAVTRLVGK